MLWRQSWTLGRIREGLGVQGELGQFGRCHRVVGGSQGRVGGGQGGNRGGHHHVVEAELDTRELFQGLVVPFDLVHALRQVLGRHQSGTPKPTDTPGAPQYPPAPLDPQIPP